MVKRCNEESEFVEMKVRRVAYRMKEEHLRVVQGSLIRSRFISGRKGGARQFNRKHIYFRAEGWCKEV
jgi:hypothetical protein